MLELNNEENLKDLPYIESPYNDSFFTEMRTLNYESLRNDRGIVAVIVNHEGTKKSLHGFDCCPQSILCCCKR